MNYKDRIFEVVKGIHYSFPNRIQIKSLGERDVRLSFDYNTCLLISEELGIVYYTGIPLFYENKEDYEYTLKRLLHVKSILKKLKSEHKI